MGRTNRLVSLSVPFNLLGPDCEFLVAPTDALVRTLCAIVKKNMQKLYDEAGDEWTWSDDRKFLELRHKDSKFLILRHGDGQIAGFLAFRFEPGGVAYIYELQAVVSGRGVGTRLLQTLERICRELTNVRKLLLTVLCGNSDARRFYEKHGWRQDETCPVNAKYVVLCKLIGLDCSLDC